MERSKVIKDIEYILYNNYPMSGTFEEIAEELLNYIEAIDMLPPLSTCQLIPDILRGGTKHSSSKREWDKE